MNVILAQINGTFETYTNVFDGFMKYIHEYSASAFMFYMELLTEKKVVLYYKNARQKDYNKIYCFVRVRAILIKIQYWVYVMHEAT